MRFTKMQSAGNDYIYVNCFAERVTDPQSLAIRLSVRRFSVGSDGLVLIAPSDKADFGMRMFNADGSEGAMCGNAARCVGRYVYEKGLTRSDSVTLETKSGIKYLRIAADGGRVKSVSVNMGVPRFEGDDVVFVGNPHKVVFCDDPETFPLAEYARAVVYEGGINVEAAAVRDGRIFMRVFERGSGETFSCGSGACAAAALAARRGFAGADSTEVTTKGGTLTVTFADGFMWLDGETVTVYEGEIEL